MKTKVLYFGAIAEKLNQTEEFIEIPDDINNLRNYFTIRYPAIKDLPYLIAINQELRNERNKNEILEEIALFPPFAGG